MNPEMMKLAMEQMVSHTTVWLLDSAENIWSDGFLYMQSKMTPDQVRELGPDSVSFKAGSPLCPASRHAYTFAFTLSLCADGRHAKTNG